MMPGETVRDNGLTAQQKINPVMVEIVNRLQTEIEGCSICLQTLQINFYLF